MLNENLCTKISSCVWYHGHEPHTRIVGVLVASVCKRTRVILLSLLHVHEACVGTASPSTEQYNKQQKLIFMFNGLRDEDAVEAGLI